MFNVSAPFLNFGQCNRMVKFIPQPVIKLTYVCFKDF